MASNLGVTPGAAFLAARTADVWKKSNSIMPKPPRDPAGTGSFARFVHEIGYITDLFMDQCTTDPWMLAVSSIPAILDAFWEVVSPDPKEVYHQVVGESLVCTLKSEIRDASTLERGFWDGARKTLFKIAEVADLAVWRLFLAGVLADGLEDWQTIAQELSGCRGSKSPFSSSRAQGGMPDTDHVNLANGLEWLTNNPIYPAFVPVIHLQPGQQGHIVWCCSAKNSGNDPVPLEHWIEQSGFGPVTEHETSLPDGSDNWHHVIRHFASTNTSNEIVTYQLKAFCPVPQPHGEVFFDSGYCSITNL